jgi:hypothetical protein
VTVDAVVLDTHAIHTMVNENTETSDSQEKANKQPSHEQAAAAAADLNVGFIRSTDDDGHSITLSSTTAAISVDAKAKAHRQAAIPSTTSGLIVEQPQLLSTISTNKSSSSSSGVIVPSPSSVNRKRKRNKSLKRWRRIACQTLVVTAIALYAFLYTTLSSNPSVILSEIKSYSSGSSNDKNGYEQAQGDNTHSDVHKKKSVYEQQLPQMQRVAASIARVYEPVPPMNWCVDEKLSLDQLKRRPMGLCYLRIPHAASSTLKGINIRIATNFGQRVGVKSCIRHDTRDFGMYYPLRDKDLSFMWTFIRDPTDRAMSFVGDRLSQKYLNTRNRDDPSVNVTEMGIGRHALSMLQNSMDIRDGALSEGRGGFQLQYAMQMYIPAWSAVDPLNPTSVVNPPKVHQRVRNVSAFVPLNEDSKFGWYFLVFGQVFFVLILNVVVSILLHPSTYTTRFSKGMILLGS